MTTKARFLALGLAALVLTSFSLAIGEPNADDSSESKPEKILWLNYAEGMKAAEDSDKQILIDFTASWCGWCKKMEATTFKDDSVINMVNEHFIPIKVWGDSKKQLDVDGYKITEESLAKNKYAVSGYPTFYFLEADGEPIGKQPGYLQTAQFIEMLSYVKERKYDTTANQSPDGEGN